MSKFLPGNASDLPILVESAPTALDRPASARDLSEGSLKGFFYLLDSPAPSASTSLLSSDNAFAILALATVRPRISSILPQMP